MTGLAALNAAPEQEAFDRLRAVCASPRWARTVARRRPYASVEELCVAADEALAGLAEADVDEALAGHPRIGERPGTGTSSWSRQEQSGVAEGTREALAAANQAYEERFGHVYLVCATGRSGEELLALLRERLANPPGAERVVLREELRRINRIRLGKMLA